MFVFVFLGVRDIVQEGEERLSALYCKEIKGKERFYVSLCVLKVYCSSIGIQDRTPVTYSEVWEGQLEGKSLIEL